jgi:hypothetical protein
MDVQLRCITIVHARTAFIIRMLSYMIVVFMNVAFATCELPKYGHFKCWQAYFS